MPPNRLSLYDRKEADGPITEAIFNQLIDQGMALYTPLAKAQGATLTADRRWDDPTVNAYADQTGNAWEVDFFGGFARRPELTPDAFALVICHEMGHHFGGYPFTPQGTMSAEGQADYYATDVCAKALWGHDLGLNKRFLAIRNIPRGLVDQCSQAFPNNANGQAFCVRATAAGQVLANLLSKLSGDPVPPSIERPDPTVVTVTDNVNHPHAQCRLDTMLAGTVCTKAWNPALIPGKFNPAGSNSAPAEADAMKFSCFTKAGDHLGARPLCWFKPLN